MGVMQLCPGSEVGVWSVIHLVSYTWKERSQAPAPSKAAAGHAPPGAGAPPPLPPAWRTSAIASSRNASASSRGSAPRFARLRPPGCCSPPASPASVAAPFRAAPPCDGSAHGWALACAPAGTFDPLDSSV